MKTIWHICLIIFLFTITNAQDQPQETPYYGQMIYWKSLSTREKSAFLFAYLSCSYEIVKQMETEVSPADLKKFRKKYTEAVERVFSLISENPDAEGRIIQWIDIFYDTHTYQISPFRDALRWAYEKYNLENEK